MLVYSSVIIVIVVSCFFLNKISYNLMQSKSRRAKSEEMKTPLIQSNYLFSKVCNAQVSFLLIGSQCHILCCHR